MTIDIIMVFSYLILLLIVGIYNKSKLTSFTNYANIRNNISNNKLFLIATIFASSVGGATTFGLSEKAFSGDISYTYGLILAIPVDILIAIYLVPQIIKHYGAQSIGDIMAIHYGRLGRFIAGLTTIIVSIGFVGAQISVSGYIFQYLLHINYIEGVILSYGIVIIYTTLGGIQSIIFTNLIQFFAMIIAIPIIAICGLQEIGFLNFFQQIPPQKVYLFHNHSFDNALLLNTITAMLGFYVMNLYPHFIQRTLMNKNSKETSKAIYIKSAIYAVFLVFVTINGLIAYYLFPNQTSTLALPYLIGQVVPAGLQGIVIIGLLAAVMSTADSDLNITTIALIKDLLNPLLKIQDQGRLLIIARITNVLIGSIAIIISLKFNNVIDLVVFITGFWGPIILIPLIFSLFGITISTFMMVISGSIGSITFLMWENLGGRQWYGVRGVFVGTMASLMISCIGLIWKRVKLSH
ncbi:sodium:solute symporter [Candidatus Tisiphia endosymbiont of Nemotelus uliginosus]|uniref:sodium:solute symporter family protein n=1 Tax=Candidatus Tisiphia endosymbiont of Nemotelus uliginosus TaxID=3077926 RepID=UPI0035C93303